MNIFTIGEQPCDNYNPVTGYFGANVHECYCPFIDGDKCSKTVSLCETCHRDHHEGGAETCICRKNDGLSSEA